MQIFFIKGKTHAYRMQESPAINVFKLGLLVCANSKNTCNNGSIQSTPRHVF